MMKGHSGWAGILVLTMGVTGSAQESVRSSQAGLTASIARANLQSQTFKFLTDTVKASDGIVYIEPGVCRRGVAACLTDVTIAGDKRILWVRVDARRADIDLIASIGHELRHAVEVLGNPTIRTNAAMYLFYVREGIVRGWGAFETAAAVEAGSAVREELRRLE
jgi:hypothetical protein